MTARPSLNACFLISRYNKFIIPEACPVPHLSIKVENTPSFGFKLGIARKNPAAVLPRSDRILMKPSPYCTIANVSDDTRPPSLPSDISNTQSRKRKALIGWQFTSQPLYLYDQIRGGKPEDDPGANVHQDPQYDSQRIASSTC